MRRSKADSTGSTGIASATSTAIPPPTTSNTASATTAANMIGDDRQPSHPSRRHSIQGLLGLFHKKDDSPAISESALDIGDDEKQVSKSTPSSRTPSPDTLNNPRKLRERKLQERERQQQDKKNAAAAAASAARHQTNKVRSHSPPSIGSTPARIQESYEQAAAGTAAATTTTTTSTTTATGGPGGGGESTLTTTKQQQQQQQQQQHRRHHGHHEQYLLADELKALFSGAPHFMLEKSKGDRSSPLVIFPWDSTSAIERLQDRQLLIHPSFTLSTVHAHLPVRWTQTGVVKSIENPRDRQGSKRASFDVGVFEAPNMLSSMGKEPGCFGFAYFMEAPVGDMVVYGPSPYSREMEAGGGNGGGSTASSLAGGVLETFRISREPYHAVCYPAVSLDRSKLIRDGPHAWKQLGVRNVSMKKLTERLVTLANIRHQILEEDQPFCLLDAYSTAELHHSLYSTLLFPPPLVLVSHAPNVKTQINILARVLGVKGAWVDFTLVEWRLRLGQLLWEYAPHQEDNCLDHANHATPAGNVKDAQYATERKWLLIQLVLSLELLLRLDAAVRVGLTGKRKGFVVTPQDVYALNNIRTDASYWNILVVRRLLDNMDVHYVPTKEDELEQAPPPPPPKSRFRFKLHSSDEPPVMQDEPAWSCVLLPKKPQRQLGGVLTFAQRLKWPNFEQFKENLSRKINAAIADPQLGTTMFSSPVRASPLPPGVPALDKTDIFAKNRTCHLLRLHHPGKSAMDDPTYIGGWLSRSWLTGCVLPGEAAHHLLMCTILENDPQANKNLGVIANMYGGFVYSGRSWWSRMCIVGRVLGCMQSAAECMGWMYAPLSPESANGEMYGDSWFEIKAIDTLRSEHKFPRIHQPQSVLHDSSPLGWEGKLTASVFSLPVDDSLINPETKNREFTITFEKLVLERIQGENQKPGRPLKAQALVRFVITRKTGERKVVTFPLSYAVCFISSFPCLTPNGFRVKTKNTADPSASSSSSPVITAKRRDSSTSGHSDPTGKKEKISHTHPTGTTTTANSNGGSRSSSSNHHHNSKRSRRLPAHFLHTSSYPHEYLSLESLPNITSFPPREKSAEVGDVSFRTAAITAAAAAAAAADESAIVDDDDTPPPSTKKHQRTSSGSITGRRRTSGNNNNNNNNNNNSRSYSSSSATKKTVQGTQKQQGPKTTYIIDARGSKDKEVFARAWCASVGVSAVVGRTGRTCLSCTIREARACDVGVVIRTSGPEETFDAMSSAVLYP